LVVYEGGYFLEVYPPLLVQYLPVDVDEDDLTYEKMVDA